MSLVEEWLKQSGYSSSGAGRQAAPRSPIRSLEEIASTSSTGGVEASSGFFVDNPFGKALSGLIRTVDAPRAAVAASVAAATGRSSWADAFDRRIGFAEASGISDTNMPGWLKSTVGFGLDLLTDPLLYVGAAPAARAISTAGRAAGAGASGGRGAARMGALGRTGVGGPAVPLLTEAGETVANPLAGALARGGARKDLAVAVERTATARYGAQYPSEEIGKAVASLSREAGRRGSGAFTRRGLQRAGLTPAQLEDIFQVQVKFGYGARAPGRTAQQGNILSSGPVAAVGEFRQNVFGSTKNYLGSTKAASAIRQMSKTSENRYNEIYDKVVRGTNFDDPDDVIRNVRYLVGMEAARGDGRLFVDDAARRQRSTVGRAQGRRGLVLSDEESRRVIADMERRIVDSDYVITDPVAKSFSEEFDRLRQTAIDAGVPEAELPYLQGYFPHTMSQDSLKALDSLDPEIVRAWGIDRDAGFMLPRSLRKDEYMALPDGERVMLQEGSVAEINRVWDEYQVRAGTRRYKLLNEDPINALGAYTDEMGRIVQRASFGRYLMHYGYAKEAEEIAVSVPVSGRAADEAAAKRAALRESDEYLSTSMRDEIGEATTIRAESQVLSEGSPMAPLRGEELPDPATSASVERKQTADTASVVDRHSERISKEIADRETQAAEAKLLAASLKGELNLARGNLRRSRNAKWRQEVEKVETDLKTVRSERNKFKKSLDSRAATLERRKASALQASKGKRTDEVLRLEEQLRVLREESVDARRLGVLERQVARLQKKSDDFKTRQKQTTTAENRILKLENDLNAANLRYGRLLDGDDKMAPLSELRRTIDSSQATVDEMTARVKQLDVFLNATAPARSEAGRRIKPPKIDGTPAPKRAEELSAQNDLLRKRNQNLLKIMENDLPEVDPAQLPWWKEFIDIEMQAIQLDAQVAARQQLLDHNRMLDDAINNSSFRQIMEYKVDEGYKKWSKTVQVTDDVHAEIVSQINEFKSILRAWGQKAGLPDEAIATAERVRDYMQSGMNWWKGWAVGSPGFVSRNLQGGLYNMYMDGVEKKSVDIFFTAYRHYAAGTVNGVPWQDRAIASLAKRRDVAGEAARRNMDVDVLAREIVEEQIDQSLRVAAATGWGQAAQEVSGRGTTARRRVRPTDADNKYTGAIRDLATHSEAIMRGAHAFDVLRKGGDFNTAVGRVTKFHFNYQDIGRADRAIKQVIPFWSFFSRNLPLQAEMWSRYPARLNRTYFNGVRNFSDQGQELEARPKFFDEMGLIQTGMRTSAGDRLHVGLDLPFLRIQDDVSKAFPEPYRVLNDAYPWFKLPIEQLANKSLFYDAPWKDSTTRKVVGKDGQMRIRPREAGWVMDNPVLRPLLAPLPGFENIGGTLAITDRAENVVRQIPPLARTQNLLFPSERQSTNFSPRLVSFLTGVQVRPNTPDMIAREQQNAYSEQQKRERRAADSRAALETILRERASRG
jgi:hypothetical protein